MTGQPWEPIVDESARAFSAFVVYRDLGPTRSLAKVRSGWGQMTGDLGVNLGQPPSAKSIETWSARNSWVIRASSFDKHMARVHVAKLEEGRRLAAEQELEMSDRVFKKISTRIDTLNWAEADFLDLRRMAETFGRIRRLALGAPTESVQVTGKDGGPLQVDYSQFTDEERYERMRHLRAEIDKRLDAAEGGMPHD